MVFNPPPNQNDPENDDEQVALIREVEILLVAICAGLVSFFSAIISIGFTFQFIYPGTQFNVGLKFLKMKM